MYISNVYSSVAIMKPDFHNLHIILSPGPRFACRWPCGVLSRWSGATTVATITITIWTRTTTITFATAYCVYIYTIAFTYIMQIWMVYLFESRFLEMSIFHLIQDRTITHHHYQKRCRHVQSLWYTKRNIRFVCFCSIVLELTICVCFFFSLLSPVVIQLSYLIYICNSLYIPYALHIPIMIYIYMSVYIYIYGTYTNIQYHVPYAWNIYCSQHRTPQKACPWISSMRTGGDRTALEVDFFDVIYPGVN